MDNRQPLECPNQRWDPDFNDKLDLAWCSPVCYVMFNAEVKLFYIVYSVCMYMYCMYVCCFENLVFT